MPPWKAPAKAPIAMKIGIWDIALAQLNIVEINGFIRLLSRYAVIEYAEALFIQLIEKNYVWVECRKIQKWLFSAVFYPLSETKYSKVEVTRPKGN